MNRFSALVVVVLLASCSTSDYDQPARGEGRRGPSAGQPRGAMRGAEDLGLGLIPLDNWWHDPQIAEPLNLSSEQYAALDRTQSEQGDELARLQRDSMVALRDFRQSLTADKASQDDIVAAGQRLRGLRDEILGRQVKLIATQRVILTAEQWQKLQQEMREDRGDWRDNRRVPRRPGRGGRGGWGGGINPRGGPGGWRY